MYSKKTERLYPDSENQYRGITYLGTLADKFAVSWCGTYSQWDTLEAAVSQRNFLESPEGQQDRIQREERRQARIAYDLARAERKAQESIAMQIVKAEVGYYDDEQVFA